MPDALAARQVPMGYFLKRIPRVVFAGPNRFAVGIERQPACRRRHLLDELVLVGPPIDRPEIQLVITARRQAVAPGAQGQTVREARVVLECLHQLAIGGVPDHHLLVVNTDAHDAAAVRIELDAGAPPAVSRERKESLSGLGFPDADIAFLITAAAGHPFAVGTEGDAPNFCTLPLENSHRRAGLKVPNTPCLI